MTQTKLVFGESLNMPSDRIRHYDLIDKLASRNKMRRRDGLPELDLSDYCARMNINYQDEIRKPVDRMKYYTRFSKRTYNKK